MLFYFSINLSIQGFINIDIWSVPVDHGVEDYERDDGGPDVQDGVHPEQVDAQVPEVAPNI